MRLLVLLLCLVLSSCGFQLRGAAPMPFASLYIESGGVSIAGEVVQALQTGSTVQMQPKPAGAETVLQLFGEQREKRILSLSSIGKVSEYMLIYRVSFRLKDEKGVAWSPEQMLELRRDFTFSEAQVLAKAYEEELLYQEMRRDAVRQLLFRLSVMKKTPVDAD